MWTTVITIVTIVGTVVAYEKEMRARAAGNAGAGVVLT